MADPRVRSRIREVAGWNISREDRYKVRASSRAGRAGVCLCIGPLTSTGALWTPGTPYTLPCSLPSLPLCAGHLHPCGRLHAGWGRECAGSPASPPIQRAPRRDAGGRARGPPLPPPLPRPSRCPCPCGRGSPGEGCALEGPVGVCEVNLTPYDIPRQEGDPTPWALNEASRILPPPPSLDPQGGGAGEGGQGRLTLYRGNALLSSMLTWMTCRPSPLGLPYSSPNAPDWHPSPPPQPRILGG